ncbi:unnamed protein product [Cuscuta campestris]|uniref:Uncharacterized protein n=1 Tax=Cuscuta campestris TaxID=132261 RepID=A0A484MSD7_9ASTE|nr:unnamed protein product [Cuscuta campestris]
MPTRSSEMTRHGGRRKAKTAASARKKKKQPQRGMGVAQLEQLIMRDPATLKKTTNDDDNVTPPPPLHYSPVVLSPASAVSAAAMSNKNTAGIPSLPPLQFPKLASYGCYGAEQLFPSYSHLLHHHHDLYGLIGSSANNPTPNHFNVILESSKDLSATPNFSFNNSSICNLCQQETLLNDRNSGCNFNTIQENQYYFTGFSPKPFYHAGCAFKQGGVAVEKNKKKMKRSSSSSSKGVVEYEFFPERSSSFGSHDDDDDDMVMMMSTPTVTTRPSSPDVTAMGSFDGSSSTTVDLSLRLSY